MTHTLGSPAAPTYGGIRAGPPITVGIHRRPHETMISDLKAILSLLVFRPDAHALDIARVLGARQGAAHLRSQIQTGLVELPFTSTALSAKVLQIAEETPAETWSPATCAERILREAETDMGLRMAMDEIAGLDQPMIERWIVSLTPQRAASPSEAPIVRERPAKASKVAPAAPAGPLKARAASWFRQPINAAVIVGFLAVAGYKLITPAPAPNMNLSALGDPNLPFPGASTNQSFDPTMKAAPAPAASPVLPTPDASPAEPAPMPSGKN